LAGIGVSQWEPVSEYSEDGDVAVATATPSVAVAGPARVVFAVEALRRPARRSIAARSGASDLPPRPRRLHLLARRLTDMKPLSGD